jgi:hypothetical protein
VTAVTVEIVAAEPRTDPPGADFRYVVRNDGDATVWVVDDGWLVWRRQGRRIELGFQRVPMQPGAVPFGYFDPQVVALEPGAELTRAITLTWPQPLERMWNESAEAAPPAGEYEVAVRVGYGESPAPPPVTQVGESVEAPVLGWQREAVSAPVPLTVPG